MLQHFNEVTDTVADLEDPTVQQSNTGNTWLQFLQGGPKKLPYLRETGKLRKKPKVMHYSARQRRITKNG